MLSQYVPLLIFLIFSAGLAVLLVLLSGLFGPRRDDPKKLLPYECGILTDRPTRRRLSVKFYLTAMIFIIFDVEAIFFYPWAVLVHRLRWYGIIEMLVFMIILGVALAHIWGKGGLEWE